MRTIKIDFIEYQSFLSVDQGRRLEMIGCDEQKNRRKDIHYPIATIFADENTEKQYIEICCDEVSIQLPIASIEKAIELARSDVHSESWFEKNVYDKLEKDE